MEEAFATLVWVVAALGAIVAVFTLIASGSGYRQIGGGGIMRHEHGVDGDLREEIRQHVLARNARRVRAGADPLDVDDEIERRIRELT